MRGFLCFQVLWDFKYQLLIGVELGKPQFAHIEGIDDTEINPNQIKILAKNMILFVAIKTNLSAKKACKIQPLLCRLKTGRYIILVKVDQNDNNARSYYFRFKRYSIRPKTIEAQNLGKQKFNFQKSRNQLVKIMKLVWVQCLMICLIKSCYNSTFIIIKLIIFLIIVLDKVVNFEAYSTLYVVASGVVLAHIFNLLL